MNKNLIKKNLKRTINKEHNDIDSFLKGIEKEVYFMKIKVTFFFIIVIIGCILGIYFYD